MTQSHSHVIPPGLAPDHDCQTALCVLLYVHAGCAVALRPDWTQPRDPVAAVALLWNQHAEQHQHAQVPGAIVVLHVPRWGTGLLAQQDFCDCPLLHTEPSGLVNAATRLRNIVASVLRWGFFGQADQERLATEDALERLDAELRRCGVQLPASPMIPALQRDWSLPYLQHLGNCGSKIDGDPNRCICGLRQLAQQHGIEL